MKTILTAITAILLYGSALAQENNVVKQPQPDPENITYCAVLKDGAMIIMSEGKQVYQDIALSSGFIIRSNAMLVNEEGKETALVNGDCVDMNGKILPQEKKVDN